MLDKCPCRNIFCVRFWWTLCKIVDFVFFCYQTYKNDNFFMVFPSSICQGFLFACLFVHLLTLVTLLILIPFTILSLLPCFFLKCPFVLSNDDSYAFKNISNILLLLICLWSCCSFWVSSESLPTRHHPVLPWLQLFSHEIKQVTAIKLLFLLGKMASPSSTALCLLWINFLNGIRFSANKLLF